MFNTPIQKIDNIYVKLEYKNPAGSIKDRPAYFMIQDALKKGYTQISEATSGNTGIALAYYGAKYGIKVNIFMPSHFSLERQKLLKLYGANLILIKGSMADALQAAQESKEHLINQFDNPLNAYSHTQTTAPEILSQVPHIDAFVAGVGSGGTLQGIAQILKRKGVKIIAVESIHSPVIYNVLHKENHPLHPHKIQGIGAGFLPANLDTSLIDESILIDDQEAIEFAKTLPKRYGITGGFSTAANILAAQKCRGSVVTIACDSIERYLSES